MDNMNPSSPQTIPIVSTFTNPFDTVQPNDPTKTNKKPIAFWPGMYHSPVTAALWEAKSNIFEKLIERHKVGEEDHAPPPPPPPPSELLTKTPKQSRTRIVYNFSSDYVLREQYRDPWNEVRIGKLLEDLDVLAGTISVKHCYDEHSTTRPPLLVTASVDKIVLKKPISVDLDLEIIGSVIWTGRSSIEVLLELSQSTKEESDAAESVALTAIFIFVARDSKTGKAAPVNRLSPETDKEKILFEAAEARSKLRKRKRVDEVNEYQNGDRLETLLAEGTIFCDMPALADRDSILLRDTRLENALICQPQQRNIHGRIFGGFLLLRAFELAFSTAYAFAGLVPYFLEVDHVDFLKPVDVGNFLRFKSCVLYTELDNPEQPLINVEAVAHVTRPELGSSELSNTFYFTFTVRPEAKASKNGFRVRKVVPATEEEARHIIERMGAKAYQTSRA